jgi:hypothetical protein
MSAGRTTAGERLRTFILLLGSEHAGEVVSAARHIVRLLRSKGADLHALADRVDGGPRAADGRQLFTEDQAKEIYFRGVEDGRQQAEKTQAAPTFQSVDGPSWHEIAVACAAHPDRLRNDREKEFVEDMVRRLIHGGEPSERQANWLRKIYARRR